MKRTLQILILLLILSGTNILGQNFFISTGGGYNFSIGGSYGYTDTIQYNSDGNYRSKTNKNTTLGRGVNFNFNIGYNFKSNISTEINLSYLQSENIKNQLAVIHYSNANLLIYQYNSNSFRLIPTIGFNKKFNKFNTFIKFGCVLGTSTLYYEITTKDITISDKQQIVKNYSFEKWKYYGGFSVGYNVRLGIEYNITNQIIFFSEFNVVDFFYNNKKGKLIIYEENDVDKLSALDVYDKEINFVNKLSYFEDNLDKSKPQEKLKKHFNYNSVGINCGIKFKF